MSKTACVHCKYAVTLAVAFRPVKQESIWPAAIDGAPSGHHRRPRRSKTVFQKSLSKFYRTNAAAHTKFKNWTFETKNQKFTINIKLEHSKRKKVHDLLQQSFGKTINIEYTETGGEKTLYEIEQYQNKQNIDKAEQTELVKSVKKYFPDAEIKKINLLEND